uniref:SIMPL domain-containing protein n=2 Tax=Flavobacterium sp. TaxID=239 RepID=UPI0040491F40
MKLFIGIVSFLILASCQNSSSNASSKFKTMMIKSSGEVEVMPDMATFFINLECLDMSVKTSKNCLVEKSNELTDKLLSFGINKNDILTASVDMNKSFKWINNTSVFEGYKSSTTVFVTIKNIDKLDEVYTELLENRNLNLGGLNYAHSKIDSLKNEAYVHALENAGVLSDKLLAKMPETDKEILKIGNVELSASMPEANESNFKVKAKMYEFDGSFDKSISINKGTITISATLFVEYLIK